MGFKTTMAGAAALSLFALAAEAATFDELYVFGDSLNDCCVNAAAPFTNGTETWLVEFADAIGANYSEPSITNYAAGGAQSGDFNAIAGGGVTAPDGLQSQIDQFQADAPTIERDDMAVIWVGTNDIWASSYENPNLFGIGGLNVVQPLGLDPTAEDLAAYIGGNIQTAVTDLEAAGFGSVLLLTPYDMANSALVDFGRADVDAAIAQNTAYSEALRDVMLDLYTPGIDTYVLDVIEIIATLQDDAPANGFEFLTGYEPCDGDVACEERAQAEQDSYMFIDFVHLTTATNSVIAGAATDLVLSGETVSPIPLPAAGWLLLAGLGGLGLVGRRRRHATAC